jgi:probable F420-dependent oxidoreductase
MRVTTSLPQEDLRKVPELIRSLEAEGYDGVGVQENRHNPFLPLAVAAVNSERIQLATSVAIAFARSPMVVANMSWDLQKASGGRFVLGLGSQVKGHNERRFSVKWSAPVPRMREYIQGLRAIWRCWATGDRLAFEGEHYQFTLMTPNFTPDPIDCAPPPVTISAVGPAMLKLAGEVCDGVRLHGFCTPKYLRNVVLPRLEAGFEVSGRKRENFEIVGGGFIATGADDAAVAKTANWIRQRIGFYGSTRAYWPVLEEHGLEELGLKLNYMSKNDQWNEMTNEVSDDVVRLFAAVGRFDELAKVVEDHFGGISDTIGASASVNEPGGLPADLMQDLKRIPTKFASYAV